MRHYVAGADGGGTKTMVQVMSVTGASLGRRELGSLNVNGQTLEQIRQTLGALVDVLKNTQGGLDACAALCIATAGVSNPKAREIILTCLKQLGYSGTVLLAGDQEAALQGAMGKAQGIVLIAGTGSICYGKNETGDSARAGGWGYLIDDYGGAYAIGLDILQAIVRAYDGRSEQTCLTQLVFEHLKIQSIPELMGFLYAPKTGKQDIAGLAPFITQGIMQADWQSGQIVLRAAKELAALVVPVAKTLNMQKGQVALSGSVLSKNQAIANATKQLIHQSLPHFEVITPMQDAAVGAAQMALYHIKNKGDNYA